MGVTVGLVKDARGVLALLGNILVNSFCEFIYCRYIKMGGHNVAVVYLALRWLPWV